MTNKINNPSYEKRNCSWSGCKETIYVKTTIEKTQIGEHLNLVVGGWCSLHKLAYNIYHSMESKKFGFITAKIYKDNKKELDKMRKHAVQEAKRQLRLK